MALRVTAARNPPAPASLLNFGDMPPPITAVATGLAQCGLRFF